jgi:hypothetical protein
MVKYLQNDTICYGEVKYFFEIKEFIYACLSEYVIISEYFLDEARGISSEMFYELLELNIFKDI